MKRVSVVIELEIDTALELGEVERVLDAGIPSVRELEGLWIRERAIVINGETDLDELSCNCDRPGEIQCELHGPRE